MEDSIDNWIRLTASITFVCFVVMRALSIWDKGTPANKPVPNWVPIVGGLAVIIGTPVGVICVLLVIWR